MNNKSLVKFLYATNTLNRTRSGEAPPPVPEWFPPIDPNEPIRNPDIKAFREVFESEGNYYFSWMFQVEAIRTVGNDTFLDLWSYDVSGHSIDPGTFLWQALPNQWWEVTNVDIGDFSPTVHAIATVHMIDNPFMGRIAPNNRDN